MIDGAGIWWMACARLDRLRVLVVVGVDPLRIAVHLHDQFRDVAQQRDQIVDEYRGIDHSCLPPSARSRISFGFISCSTRRAASATAALFLGENTSHGSIFWLAHALIRSLRVELLAFALLSR